jgi:hypothetical protein
MYELKAINQELLDKTKAAWNEQLERLSNEEDIFLARSYKRKIDWVEDFVSEDGVRPSHELVHPHALVAENEDYATVVLEMTYRRNRAIKIINPYLEPELDFEQRETVTQSHRGEAARAIARSVVKAFGLTFEDRLSADRLKTHISSDETRGYVKALIDKFPLEESPLQELKSDSHGNWLVFEK